MTVLFCLSSLILLTSLAYQLTVNILRCDSKYTVVAIAREQLEEEVYMEDEYEDDYYETEVDF